MSARDRAKWNQTYKSKADTPYPRPDMLLLDYTPAPREGANRALDLAGGRGQNGLWLATQGYTVDIIDISRVALDQAQQEMAARGIRKVNLLSMDLDTTPLEPAAYDVVCIFRFLNRRLLGEIAESIKQGGRIIYETYTLQYLDEKPDFNPDFCLLGNELASAFDGWRILLNTEGGPVAQFVAIKP
ncbi:MAG: class I SAM-dependent methyltransferase [Chloroflexi bacterium]|nr:class I SAM-dependent methyltransferase [Chloroflexota bacterium]